MSATEGTNETIETGAAETTGTGEELPAQKMSGAEARAARLAKKNAKAAQSPVPAATGKTRTVNAVPKSSTKGGKSTKAEKSGDDAKSIADKNAAAIALEQGRQQREKDRAEKKAAREAEQAKKATERAEAKAKRETEAAAREAAKAERAAQNAPVIMPGEYPSIEMVVPLAKLRELPELVGARPSAHLIDSIKERGVIEPVILARRTEDDQDFRIVGGRRRIMASIQADRAEIPARVYSVGDKLDNWFAGMTLHLHGTRSENIAAEVQAVGALRGTHTIERIARELDMPIGTVKKRAKLLELLPEVQALLYGGKVPHTVIAEMAGLSEDRQRGLVDLFNTTGKLSHKDVKAARNAGKATATGDLDFDNLTDGPDAGDVEAGTVRSRRAAIADSGDLVADVLGFLSDSAEASGITFDLAPDGTITLTRNGQAVILTGRGGTVPTADVETGEPDADADTGEEPVSTL